MTIQTKQRLTPKSKAQLFDLTAPEWYLNRELTWLDFNKRVLWEAEDERTPLLERVKFIAIVSSNLDEFFMKRIGGLKQQVGAGISELSVDGRSPQQQIIECYAVVRELEAKKQMGHIEAVSQAFYQQCELLKNETEKKKDVFFMAPYGGLKTMHPDRWTAGQK